jgi:hypothetical protein
MALTKRCTTCGEERPLDQFYKRKNRNGAPDSICNPCRSLRTKAYHKAKPELRRIHKQKWKAKFGGAAWYSRYARKYILKRHYGITLEDHAALVAAQDGKCALCGQAKKLVIDHDHKTGKVRGLLCRHCNFVLGLYERYGDTWKAYVEGRL